MIVCSSMCTDGASALAARRRAGDAHARRGHRLEASLGDALAAHLALAVGAGVELRQRVLDVLQGLAELPGESFDLTPLGGDLAGVGAVLVEVEAGTDGVGGGAVTESRQLLADPVAVLLELVAQHLLGGLCHGSSLPPTPSPEPRASGPSGRHRVSGRVAG